MKFPFISLFLSVLLFISCNQDVKNDGSSSEPVASTSSHSLTKSPATASPAQVDRSAPKVSGIVYEGILPCADCEGIKTSLKLSSNFLYSISETYAGKSQEPVTSTGFYNEQYAYQGNPELGLLTLTDKRTGSQRYFMRHERTELILLDSKKKIIGGDDPYKLRINSSLK